MDYRDPYRRLAASIVLQAVDDWWQLVEAHVWLDNYFLPQKNFEELRAFFKSEWCEFLLIHTDVKPGDILQQLEKELQEAKEKECTSTVSRYTLKY